MTGDCIHLDFLAEVEISRLFADDVSEAASATTAPDSLAIDIRVRCAHCGKAVRFEGPIGVAVGPSARPMVSVNGIELRASGHMGENRTPPISVTVTHD